MTNKDIINFAKFYEKYRYNNNYINLTDHNFFMEYKRLLKLKTN